MYFRWCGALGAAALLSGCAAQFIRDDAQQQLKAGLYEQALRTYQDGVARYPDNVPLRAGLASARETVFARLVSSASAARTSGNDKEAAEIVRRALAINPNDARAGALGLDIERDRRQKEALASARELAGKGMRERAMLVVETALKDNPKNTELLALQRQWELETRQSELVAARLAETRPISLDFRDANLRMVLDVLTRNSGINFVIDKDVRQDLRTTVFLRQTRLEDALELITTTSQLAYKVLDSATVLVYPKTPEKAKEYQDLVIRAFYLSSADVKQTAALLKTMLKIREPFIDEKLNLIVIRETPETVRLAERLIALQDLAEPEVMMEVEVLEIKTSSLTELGIKYPDNLSLTPIAPAGSTGFTLGSLRGINRDTIGVNTPNLQINLHRDVGNVNILANPKIRARNREKAKILIGDKLPVITTTGSAANSNFISESVQYVDVGLKLDVEPNIYLDDEVAIKVGLEVSSLVREIKTSAGSLVYQIGTRTANTVLRLHDGETQLLAGLINNEERMSANRVPGVGDLPLVGRLFSSQRDDGQRTEIVLSITPRIVHNIRRPDLNQIEFWSGTENDIRSRPLTLPGVPKANDGKAPGTPAPLPPGLGGPPSAAVPLIGPGGQPPPQTGATLKLMVPSEVRVGDTFAVHVNLKADTPVRGVPMELAFDPKVLQVLDAEEGAFFTQDGAAISKTRVLEQDKGRASMGILRNQANGSKGEGTVMTFRFKALAAGQAGLRVVSAKPIAMPPLDFVELPNAPQITVK
ncbi:cohesin domain-containing protein [Janthinobacterium agaricidamnosum]|uniref:Bacterial type II and III secretion system family protein n=1 Tax=Janthinobacterium agaricidamnosum NBRC 102515 = DSM 9628 TaxID=1349767 RepID=W0V3R3_9BURK|nr:cohesin domain-containing protein [Janthinobacterium agaricidamnosum]CDG81978.1 bacterial type II and III secretion system family protein [Janthinobacterium agaricidamnosum NBRC 102515 = DSM 9628]